MIEIKDFPEGTKLNILYNAPIYDYFNHKVPPYLKCDNRNYVDKFPINKINVSDDIPLFVDKIDFSDVEELEWVSSSSHKSSTPSNFVLNLPKIKNVKFNNVLISNMDDIITLNLGDDLVSINGAPEFNQSKGIFTLNSNSKNIKTISNVDPYNLNTIEFKINCDCEGLTTTPYVTNYSERKDVTYHSGFPNCKYSTNDNNYYVKFPNLTYESCISILNNLYDFTGNGVTPSSSQGKLKVHSNFLSLVGDEISIGTNKGWTITA